jgi:hypothetical protein
VSVIWFPVAFLLGKRYESLRSGELIAPGSVKAAAK